MKDRIVALLKNKGMTASRFAELINVQPSGVSHVLSGRNNPGYDFIINTLRSFPDINPDWLLLGIGAMYRLHSDTMSPVDSSLFGNDVSNDKAPVPVHDEKSNHADMKALNGNPSVAEVTAAVSQRTMPNTSSDGDIPTQMVLLYPDGTSKFFKMR
jgi:transcriptional regulator with XRE-family HTH domain